MIIPDLFLLTQPPPPLLLARDGKKQTKDYLPSRITIDFLHALNLNMEQLYTYLKTLVEYDRTFSSSEVNSLLNIYLSAKKRYVETKASKNLNSTAMESVAAEMKEFIRGVRLICTEKWAKFNDTYIYTGMAFLLAHFVCVCVMFLYNSNMESTHHRLMETLKRIFSIDWTSLLSLVLIVFHSFSLFSNSFVVYEGNVVTFSSQTLIIVLAFGALRRLLAERGCDSFSDFARVCFKVLWPYCGVMACIKLSAVFHSCRDQQDDCEIGEMLKPLMKHNVKTIMGSFLKISFFSASWYLYRVSVTYCEQTFAKYLYDSKHYRKMFFSLFFLVTCESVFIVLLISIFDELLRIVSVVSAWIIYAVFGIGLIGIFRAPWYDSENYFKELNHDRLITTCKTGYSKNLEDIVHCLFPVSHLFVIVLTPVLMLVAVPNDSYTAAIGLMVLQLCLTIVILQETPQGKEQRKWEGKGRGYK